MAASWSPRVSMMSAILCSTRERWRGRAWDHSPDSKARFAAATARSMSAALPEAAVRYGSLVTGSSTSKVSPSIESTNSPSM